ACGGLLLDAAGHAMGGKHGHGAWRNFGEILDKDRAFVLQALDHVFVMHDLVTDIDRRAGFFVAPVPHLRGAPDTGAKAARLREIHFHRTAVTQAAPHSCLKPPSAADICNIRTIRVPAPNPGSQAPWKHRALCQKNRRGERQIAKWSQMEWRIEVL